MGHVFLRGHIHQKVVGRSPPAKHTASSFYRHRRAPGPSSFFETQ